MEQELSSWMENDTESNRTDYEDFEHYDATTIFVIATNCLIMLISIPSNLVVLLAIRKIGRPKQSTFTFISKHLCIASLVIACVTLPINTIWRITFYWHAEVIGCKLFMALRVIGFYMTAFLITILSINRLLIVKYQKSIYTDKRTVICVYLFWALAVMASLPQIFAFGIHRFEQGDTQCALWLGQIDPDFGTYFNHQAYSIAHFSVCYVLPVIVLCGVQCAFLTVLKRQSKRDDPIAFFKTTITSNRSYPVLTCTHSSTIRYTLHSRTMLHVGHSRQEFFEGSKPMLQMRMSSSDNNGRDRWLTQTAGRLGAKSDAKLLSRARSLTLRTSATMLAFYVACWSPHYVMVFITWFHPELEVQTPALLKQILSSFALLNCAVNPLVYGFMVPTIRNISRGFFSQIRAKFGMFGRYLTVSVQHLLGLQKPVAPRPNHYSYY